MRIFIILLAASFAAYGCAEAKPATPVIKQQKPAEQPAAPRQYRPQTKIA